MLENQKITFIFEKLFYPNFYLIHKESQKEKDSISILMFHVKQW